MHFFSFYAKILMLMYGRSILNENLPTLVKNGSITIEEWNTRVDLAACYRLMAHFGMDDLIYNHISARVPGPDEHFLLNPFEKSIQI